MDWIMLTILLVNVVHFIHSCPVKLIILIPIKIHAYCVRLAISVVLTKTMEDVDKKLFYGILFKYNKTKPRKIIIQAIKPFAALNDSV